MDYHIKKRAFINKHLIYIKNNLCKSIFNILLNKVCVKKKNLKIIL